jgi:hypothetical protein
MRHVKGEEANDNETRTMFALAKTTGAKRRKNWLLSEEDVAPKA